MRSGYTRMISINIMDAPCGYGKTEWAIQYMKKNDDNKRFMFVTPYLTEVERVSNNLPHFSIPSSEDDLSKSDHIKKLVENGDSIITTHELFKHFDSEMLSLISKQEYVLILDEVMNVIDTLQLGRDALRMLVDEGRITIDKETHLIEWVEGKELLDVNAGFTNAQKLIKKKSVYEVNGVGLVWTLPVVYFKVFQDIFILTYMFDCQQQSYYYKSNKLKMNMYSVKPSESTKHNKFPNIEYELVKHEDRIRYRKDDIRALINIYEGKLNTLGQTKHHNLKKDPIPRDGCLSSNWFENSKDGQIEALSKGLVSYFQMSKSKNEDKLWTCKKGYKSDRRSLVNDIGDRIRKYSKFHIPLNLRGTNEYQDRFNLAYITNVFLNPIEYHYFHTIHKVEVDEDMWSLSELIQWVYRSRIRKGEQINIWIPSIRMRELFKWWLNQDEI